MPLRPADKRTILQFLSAFVWTDFEVSASEVRVFTELALELGVPRCELATWYELLDAPPHPEAIDPTIVAPHLARAVRNAARRAMAADGQASAQSHELYMLLEELLPAAPPGTRRGIASQSGGTG